MKVTAVLLAAGQGTRMKTSLPKVLHPVCGKPMLAYAFEAACSASTGKPVIVVGKDGEPIRNYLGDAASYVLQDPQLGTGHAVQQAEASLRGRTELVLVTYADMPLLCAETLARLVEMQQSNNGPMTIMTVSAANSRGFGRVLRNPDGSVRAISRRGRRHAGTAVHPGAERRCLLFLGRLVVGGAAPYSAFPQRRILPDGCGRPGGSGRLAGANADWRGSL